jgi:hypothetical protein
MLRLLVLPPKMRMKTAAQNMIDSDVHLDHSMSETRATQQQLAQHPHHDHREDRHLAARLRSQTTETTTLSHSSLLYQSVVVWDRERRDPVALISSSSGLALSYALEPDWKRE